MTVKVGGTPTKVPCKEVEVDDGLGLDGKKKERVWELELDLSLSEDASLSVTVDHTFKKQLSAKQVAGSLNNTFICNPANSAIDSFLQTAFTSNPPEHLFVPVPPLDVYTSKNFCVAKYEMKEVTHGGTTKILSVAKQTPKVQVTRDEAITKCETMGSGYVLITNAEWQTIARQFESNDKSGSNGSNWKNENLGMNVGNGHEEGLVTVALEASTDDNEACYGMKYQQQGNTNIEPIPASKCSKNQWNERRRIHFLPNGEVIWDMSGNVAEWVKDNRPTNFDVQKGVLLNAFFHTITDTTHQ